MQNLKLWTIVKIKTWKLDANAKNEWWKYPFFTCSKNISRINTYTYDCECVLVAWNGDLNVKYYNWKFDAYQRTYIIEDNKTHELDIKFLYYFMQSYIEKLRDQTIGWVIQYIKLVNLTDIDFPLPPLQTQKQIIQKLDKLTNLIELRKLSIQKTEKLTKSIFIEMFWDPMINEKGWEVKKLSDFWLIQTWNTPSREDKTNYWNYIEWIKSDNINNSSIFATKSIEFLSELWAKKWRIAKAWSILVTCIAWSLSCIWNSWIVNRDVAFNQQINSLTPNINYNSFFVFYLFEIWKKIIQNSSTNSMKWMISKSVFENINFYSPPISLQNKFASIVEKNEENIKKQKESLKKLEELYASVMQESFGV